MARNPFKNLLTRAAIPKAGLGNLLIAPNQTGGGKSPIAATSALTWASPGNPLIFDQDVQSFGESAYLGSAYVMRCVSAIAQTIAGLEFRAGLNPLEPAQSDPTAPLAQLLGPGTPQAPGGPNPETSSYAFWVWTICQYIVYGRFAWETQLSQKQIVALWPLFVGALGPIPTNGGTRYFDSYVYTPASGGNIKLTYEQCIYAWRMSLQDPRQPETVLSAAKLPIYIQMGMDKYIAKLLQNDMVASTLVVTPPFAEGSARRAWQEQFLTAFTGIDNRGKTIFAEAEADEDDTTGKPLVQVEKLAQTAVEASMIQISTQAKIDITIALGVPMSLIGNASQRTYSNADSEYRTFWTTRLLALIREIQEHVNIRLAPRIGMEVGWFDLSRVEALKPPALFAPPMIGDVIASGVASAAQVANVLGIPAADSIGAEDIETVELGEESSMTGAGGMRSVIASHGRSRGKRIYDTRDAVETPLGRVTRVQMVSAYLRYSQRPVNTHNIDQEFRLGDWIRRESGGTVVTPNEVLDPGTRAAADLAERIERRRRDHRRTLELEARRERTVAILRSIDQDNAAYHQGQSDRMAHKPMLTKAQFSEMHPSADADDYPLYQAGYNADRDDLHLELAPSKRGHTTVYDRVVPKAPAEHVSDDTDSQEKCHYCDSPATKTVSWQGTDRTIATCRSHMSMGYEALGAPTDIDGDVSKIQGDNEPVIGDTTSNPNTDESTRAIEEAIELWAGELLDVVQ